VPDGAQWTLVADAECDIFEVMTQCAHKGADWIIRASQPRKTLPDSQSVLDTVAQAPLLDTYAIALRARPGVAARTATVEVRACTREICPPHGTRSRYAPLSCGLVEVREAEPPAKGKPLHWLLLTSWPCTTASEARRVIESYTCRWLIEEYHKALKTGTKMEETQLTTAGAITAKLAIHAVVAYELLQLKLLARSRPNTPVTEDLLPPESLIVLEKKYGRPAEGWTCHSVLTTIATMGGYLGRKSDGPPGWQTIWRGYYKLHLMTEGYILFTQTETCG